MEGKIYSPVGSFGERAKNTSTYKRIRQRDSVKNIHLENKQFSKHRLFCEASTLDVVVVMLVVN